MKVCCISDTHNAHSVVVVPECDILIHAGDESYRGREEEIRNFAKWLEQQPARHKVWIPGNHSLGFSAAYPASRAWLLDHCPDLHILMHSVVEIENLKIFGSPATPWFHNWAYNFDRGADIQQIWNRIPDDTSIVVTHGPPYGILDQTNRGLHVGCEDLLKKLQQVKPKLHVFGHIHEGRGRVVKDGITYINASIMDEDYNPGKDPISEIV